MFSLHVFRCTLVKIAQNSSMMVSGSYLLIWFGSFLVGRSQSVLVDGVKSSEESVLSGVPRGIVLVSLMFLLYANNKLMMMMMIMMICHLASTLDVAYLLTTVCIVGTRFGDQVQLQSDLSTLEQWATDWGMKFNPYRCYVLSVSQ